MRRLLLVIPVIALLGAGAFVVATGPGAPTGVIDGWVIGDPVTCAQLGASSSAQCQALAARGLATIPIPAGATVTAETLHAVGDKVVDGQRVLVDIGGSHTVLGLIVVQYSNGARHAVLFGCVGTSQPAQSPDPLCPAGGTPFP